MLASVIQANLLTLPLKHSPLNCKLLCFEVRSGATLLVKLKIAIVYGEQQKIIELVRLRGNAPYEICDHTNTH